MGAPETFLTSGGTNPEHLQKTVQARTRLQHAIAALYVPVSLLTAFAGILWVILSGDRIGSIEILLVFASVLIGLVRPRLWARSFRAFESLLSRIARRRTRSVVLIGVIALALRAALLPIFPVPTPRLHDEFSYLLAGKTFALGRLANPTHPLWIQFETFHVNQRPTYMSMYPPAQGLFLALGVLVGNAWAGVWLSVGLMCAATCWALQGWLPSRWALFGALLVTIRLGTLSYFANSYWGGGAVAALGGALVVGALPRIKRFCRTRDAIIMGIGLALLANSRPYEGFLLAVVIAIALVAWAISRPTDKRQTLFRRLAIPLGIILALSAGGMAHYNARVFGNPLLLPYQLNRATYAVAPVFPWQPLGPIPDYNHKEIRDFYLGWELDEYKSASQLQGRFEQTLWKATSSWHFYVGPALTIPFFILGLVCGERRFRSLSSAAGLLVGALAVGIFFNPHYAAPATAIFFILLTQGMRRVQLLRWKGRRTGVFVVRSILPISLVVLITVACAPAKLAKAWPDFRWYYFVPSQTPRERILQRLNETAGRHLVIVRYAENHHPFHEFVYNEADIDAAKVVWAREMGPDQNERLIRYFRHRQVWLAEPDRKPPVLSPYPISQTLH